MTAVGEIRPSQLMFSFGVGALLDLPQFTALVMGLDDWRPELCPQIVEPRLLAALQRRVGPQCDALRMPPAMEDSQENIALPDRGVPVVAFPRWMRCTHCNVIAPVDSGVFKFAPHKYRMDRTGFVHCHCLGKQPQSLARAVPVRFVLACASGHLSDVPWVEFVHGGHPCAAPQLVMREFGAAGDASDIQVRCVECGVQQRLGILFSQRVPFGCSGLFPHLRKQDDACDQQVRVLNLGASNLWFGQSLSALTVPEEQSVLEALVIRHWNDLHDVSDISTIAYLAAPARNPELAEHAPQRILDAIERVRQHKAQGEEGTAHDMKLPEWEVLSGLRSLPQQQDELRLQECPPPVGLESCFENTVLVHRLREVRALYGFSRMDSLQEIDLGLASDTSVAPISNSPPTWLPACEVRGEGIFIRLREDSVRTWEQKPAVQTLDALFYQAHQAWRQSRHFDRPADCYPGVRFVLLHSFAHALMRQLALECGYTAASVRERLYCRPPVHEGGPMAGVLLYTAASDSEGTLGGLVATGKPHALSRHIRHALGAMRICASDPLCAEKSPSTEGRSLHGAACHACLFSPETSCECGNRYLDRNVLVPTFKTAHTAFWEEAL